MKTRLLLISAVLLLFPSVSLSAEIYGSIWVIKGKKAVLIGDRGEVIVQYDSMKPDTISTNRYGAYRARVLARKKCRINVIYGGKMSNAITLITSSRGRTRLNMILTRKGDKLILTRR